MGYHYFISDNINTSKGPSLPFSFKVSILNMRYCTNFIVFFFISYPVSPNSIYHLVNMPVLFLSSIFSLFIFIDPSLSFSCGYDFYPFTLINYLHNENTLHPFPILYESPSFWLFPFHVYKMCSAIKIWKNAK